MLSEKKLEDIGKRKVISIFGLDYLQKNKKITAFGMGYNNLYNYFVGIKSTTHLPDRPCTDKGWVVYADIRINANTGDIEKCEYVLE